MVFNNSPLLNARVRKILSGSTIAVCALSATAAFAEDKSTDKSEQLSEVVVTGSSIRGVAPTGSTLVSVSREQIAATSVATTTDLLRRIPQLSGFNSAPAVRADPNFSTNLPSIHGLPGAGLVLVLVDGYRAPGAGINTNSFDPSSIPTSALERLEVVPDGASAVYGSDAVTGVVNLVLRRNLDGTEATARYGFANGYNRYDGSLAAGHSWEGGNVMLAYQYTHNSILLGSDRDFVNLDHRARKDADGNFGIDFRDSRCDPGTVYVNGGTYPIPLGATGVKNKCDYVGDTSIIPEDSRNSLVLNAHQELNERMELWGEAFYSRHTAFTETVRPGYTGLTINNTNPFFQTPPGVVATSETLDYSPRNLLHSSLPGLLDFRTLAERGGLTWKFNDNWAAKFVGNFGQEHDLIQQASANSTNFNNALAGTTVATALNPFPTGGATSAAVIASLLDDNRADYDVRQKLSEGLVTVDGSLFHIGGGNVKLAVGGSLRRESLDAETTSGTASVRTTPLVATKTRTIKSEFAEVFVPIFGAENALAGLRRLEFSASVRHDDYDDVGSTTNPKYGLNWSPVNGLVLRGTYSTSFHAPSLADSSSTSIDARVIRTCCIAGPPPASFLFPAGLKNGGNSNLKPETSKNYSFGFDATPSVLPGFKFSAAYFHVAFKNQIGRIPGNVLYVEPSFAKFYIVNPTHQQYLDFIAGYRVDVQSGFPGDPGLLIDLRRQNLGAVNFGGVDFNASWTKRLAGGDFTVGVNGTRLTQYEIAAASGSSFIDQLGTGGGTQVRPIKLTARGDVGWSNELINAVAYLNYTGAYKFYANNIYHPTRSFTPVDLHFALSPFKESKWKNLQFTLDVDNVANESPPFVDEASSANGFDAQAANPYGRVITLGIRAAF
jgi:iron complex outermembrane receptor protein